MIFQKQKKTTMGSQKVFTNGKKIHFRNIYRKFAKSIWLKYFKS